MMRCIPILVVLSFLFSCTQSTNKVNTLSIKGSETLHETFMELKRDFETMQDTLVIELEGGGSRIGLMSILKSEADLGLSSFEFDLDTFSNQIVEVQQKALAIDGLVMISNKLNPLENLDFSQIANIYEGRFQDWSQLGGNPGKIEPIMRNSNSGTQQFFVGYFELDELSSEVNIAVDNAEIVKFVAQKPNAIGFIGFAYFTELAKNLMLPNANLTTEYVQPSPENLLNGKYPLKRSLLVYYQSNPSPKVKAFLNYLDSKRAREIVASTGLLPL